MATNNRKGRIAPREKQRLIQQAEFMKFHLGLQDKDIAKKLNISAQTMCKWGKAQGWRKKAETPKVDSLAAFAVFIEKKYPNKFPGLDEVIKEYMNLF